MSLLTKISKLFSKKEANQVIGISLQQQGISLCSIPLSAQKEISGENDKIEPENLSSTINTASPTFQKNKVASGDFCAELTQLLSDTDLSGQAHLVLNDQQTQIVQVDKPSVPEAEICGALKWQIKDLVTISPDNMILDYFDGPYLASGKEKINVVCASLSELQSFIPVINQNAVELASITTQEFAFANLLENKKEACLLVCQQPNEEIVLLIVREGQLHFHRRLRGFAQIATKSEDELTMTVIDNLSLEIQRSTDYYERQLKQAPIKELLVLLPIELEGFFARKLAENTNLPVSLLALPSPYQQHREYAAAIGAVLASHKEGLA
jgi:MSHA biogenesis protein MshI